MSDTKIFIEIDVTDPSTGQTHTWQVHTCGVVPSERSRFDVADEFDVAVQQVCYGLDDEMRINAHVVLSGLVIDGDHEKHTDATSVMSAAGWNTSYRASLHAAEKAGRW